MKIFDYKSKRISYTQFSKRSTDYIVDYPDSVFHFSCGGDSLWIEKTPSGAYSIFQAGLPPRVGTVRVVFCSKNPYDCIGEFRRRVHELLTPSRSEEQV